MDMITSRQNSAVRQMRKLLSRQGRKKSGLCLVEGIQQVLRALENRAQVQWIAVAPDLLTSQIAREAVAEAESRGDRVLRVTPDVFSSFSLREAPAGLAAVVEPRYSSPEDLVVCEDTMLTALLNVSDPGNLGSIIRTIDAMRGGGLLLVGDTTDPYDPAAVRASVGTVFRLPIVRMSSSESMLSLAHKRGMQVITTSVRADCSLFTAELRTPCLVVLGSEQRGLSDDILWAGDLQVRIPMGGDASSLNLAVATGIIMYEIRRGCGN